MGPPDAFQYIWVFIRTIVRLYFLYLIFSFYKRLERGETLLVEVGSRKLGRMIEELKEEQQKHQWELELTERAATNRSRI